MQVTTVGIDLAKNVFQVHGADAAARLAAIPMGASPISIGAQSML
jgi:hypothetical protein